MKAVQARVTGRVQGVSFRWYPRSRREGSASPAGSATSRTARCSLHAEGEDEPVDALVAWCRTGPSTARVSRRRRAGGGAHGATSFDPILRRDPPRGRATIRSEVDMGESWTHRGTCATMRFRALYAAHFDGVLGYALRRTQRAGGRCRRHVRDLPRRLAPALARPAPGTRLGHGSTPLPAGSSPTSAAASCAGAGSGERLRRDLDARRAGPQRPGRAGPHRRRRDGPAERADEEVLQLHLWEGLEPREIGEVLGLPVDGGQAAPVARPGHGCASSSATIRRLPDTSRTSNRPRSVRRSDEPSTDRPGRLATLPLTRGPGRALEEIMSTSVAERPTRQRDEEPRPGRR